MKYARIDSLRPKYRVAMLCRLLNVSEAGYNAWRRRPPSLHGIHAGIDHIKRIRRELDLRCRQKRKFRVTTDSRHDLPIAPNLLDRQFAVSAPNRAWVTDMTYVATDEGWLYLAHQGLV